MGAGVLEAERRGRLVEPLREDATGLNDRVPAAWLDGRLSVQEGVMAPGERVPMHVHELDDQILYVVEGTVHAQVGDDEFEVSAGGCVLKPRGVPHGIHNRTEHMARVLEITTSDRFERFQAAMARVHRDASLDDESRGARMAELGREFGVRFLG